MAWEIVMKGQAPVDFDGHDTMFYYRVDGSLRQQLRLRIVNRTGRQQSGIAAVSLEGHEEVKTELPIIREGKGTYTVLAPIVYPRFGSPPFHSKRHTPVDALVELRMGAQAVTKAIAIGRWRPWTIYVCQDSCADFTWGYDEGETVKLSTDLTEAHLREIQRTINGPPGAQNRWNINQSMEVMWFLERKGDQAKGLFAREGDGHLSISPIFNSCLTGIMTTEQAIRSLYFARELEERYGIDISVVEHIEVPTITWGMATIFAGAGIRYFVKAWYDFMAPFCINRDDIPIFHWEGPDGSRVLTASDKGACLRATYAQASFLFKPYKKAIQELHEWWIPHFESHSEYPYDAFVLLGSHGDLGSQSAGEIHRLVSNITRYNSEGWEYPRVVNANWKHFFKHIEDFVERHGISPPILRGDFGCSWEEWPAHLAAIFSGLRSGVNAFAMAEKLLALATLLGSGIYDIDRGKLEVALTRMEQLAEHPWNGSRQEEKERALRRKSKWQEELIGEVDDVIDDAIDAISSHVPTGAGDTLLVFNASSWERTDIVRVEGPGASGPLAIRDDAGVNVACDFIRLGGSGITSFIARRVPPFGYRTYRISKARRLPTARSYMTMGRDYIENSHYRVEVDRRTGGLSHIFDKKRKVDLVDQNSNYKLNQYVYLSEGVEHTPTQARITSKRRGNASCSLTIETSTLRSKIKATITLYSELDRIDIIDEIEKTPSSEPQEVHFVFPFNVPDREYHYEATAAVIRPGLAQYGGEQLRGSGQTSHACLSFVDASNERYGVTLAQVDSCLIQFGHRTTYEMAEVPDPTNSTVWSLVMLNKSPEMLADQGGASIFTFRYSIRGHGGKFRPSESVRFGWERNSDLLARPLRPYNKGQLPPKRHSFLRLEPRNVVVTALKVAEGGIGRGLIVRAWETDGKATIASFTASSMGVISARRTDLLERDRGELDTSRGKVSVPITGRGMATIRLLTSNR